MQSKCLLAAPRQDFVVWGFAAFPLGVNGSSWNRRRSGGRLRRRRFWKRQMHTPCACKAEHQTLFTTLGLLFFTSNGRL
eukprot:g19593.t1